MKNLILAAGYAMIGYGLAAMPAYPGALEDLQETTCRTGALILIEAFDLYAEHGELAGDIFLETFMVGAVDHEPGELEALQGTLQLAAALGRDRNEPAEFFFNGCMGG